MEIENLNLYKINDHRVLSVSELQEFCAGTSEPHIRELLNTGKLPKTFVGKNKIEQHKIVYKALKGKMGTELHALALNTVER